MRLTRAERARYDAAAETVGTTLAEEARRAWKRLARRAARLTIPDEPGDA